METRALGHTDVIVSRVGLGGYELGPDEGEQPDVERAKNVIEVAIDVGINWIDTSENYHATANESLIGAALDHFSDDFLIATKVAPEAGITGGASGFQHDQIHSAITDSLRRLRRDHVDIFFLHWPDRGGVPLEETWGAMAEVADAGLARAIGLSNYGLTDVQRCHAQRRVDVVQDGLSLIDHLDQRQQMASCGEMGIGVVAYEPLASGILSDKTLDEVRAVWTGPWLESGFYRRLLGPGNGERSAAVSSAMRPIAARLGVTVAQLAIAWVLHQSGVTAALAGSRDGRHVNANARSADVDIASVADTLDALIPLGPSFASG